MLEQPLYFRRRIAADFIQNGRPHTLKRQRAYRPPFRRYTTYLPASKFHI